MYHYAGNNPVRYTDPDGNIVIPAVAIYYFAVFAATTVELYLLSPSGQQGIQAASEILSYGIVSANQAVSNTIATIKTSVKEKLETKEDSLVTLYRAVSPAEDLSIQQSGTFLNPEGIECKYFSITKTGAEYEGEVLSKLDKKGEKYSIYKTALPRSQLTPDMLITVDLGVPAVVVPTEKLPMLLPPEKLE